ncbi:heparan-alpha-glucosaminide N-acetyltransferase domain-containing protein [Myxococcaceae bacterium GXIMD 01537]
MHDLSFAAPAHPPTRIRAIDWLRGLAVLVMIQTHAGVLLRPEHLKEPRFSTLVWIDGLVAPAFIFSAGFSLALVQVRGAASGSRSQRVRKTLRRLGEVLGAGLLLNLLWFHVRILRDPWLLVRMDILPCIGVALLLALPLLAALARRPVLLSGAAFTLAMLTFGLAPFAEGVTGPAAHFVNSSTGALFPLLPWAGYVYLGASVGALAAAFPRGYVLWLAALMGLGSVGRVLSPTLEGLYPPHSFWVTNPGGHAPRLELICALLLVLLALERWVPRQWTQSRVVRFLEVFSASSLAAYLIHELLIYMPLGVRWWFGGRCGWVLYALLIGVLVAVTYRLVLLSDRAYRAVHARLDGARKEAR